MKTYKKIIKQIERKIYLIREQKVILDFHLAELYDVETKVLLQAVKRNIKRFPPDFMIQLNRSEFLNLRSQIVTSRWGGRRALPFAFTEQGVAMLSSVLRSERAIQMNIAIFEAIQRLMEPPQRPRRQIVFRIEEPKVKYNLKPRRGT